MLDFFSQYTYLDVLDMLDRSLLPESKHLLSLSKISHRDMARFLKDWRPVKEFNAPGVYLLLASNEKTGEWALYIGCSGVLTVRVAKHASNIAKTYKLLATNTDLNGQVELSNVYNIIARPNWQVRTKIIAVLPRDVYTIDKSYILEALLASDGLFSTVQYWYDTKHTKQSMTTLPSISKQLSDQSDLGFHGCFDGSNSSAGHIRLNRQSPFAQIGPKQTPQDPGLCEAAPTGQGESLFGELTRKVLVIDDDGEERAIVVCIRHFRRARKAGTSVEINTPCYVQRSFLASIPGTCPAAPAGKGVRLVKGSEGHDSPRTIRIWADPDSDEILEVIVCNSHARRAEVNDRTWADLVDTSCVLRERSKPLHSKKFWESAPERCEAAPPGEGVQLDVRNRCVDTLADGTELFVCKAHHERWRMAGFDDRILSGSPCSIIKSRKGNPPPPDYCQGCDPSNAVALKSGKRHYVIMPNGVGLWLCGKHDQRVRKAQNDGSNAWDVLDIDKFDWS